MISGRWCTWISPITYDSGFASLPNHPHGLIKVIFIWILFFSQDQFFELVTFGWGLRCFSRMLMTKKLNSWIEKQNRTTPGRRVRWWRLTVLLKSSMKWMMMTTAGIWLCSWLSMAWKSKDLTKSSRAGNGQSSRKSTNESGCVSTTIFFITRQRVEETRRSGPQSERQVIPTKWYINQSWIQDHPRPNSFTWDRIKPTKPHVWTKMRGVLSVQHLSASSSSSASSSPTPINSEAWSSSSGLRLSSRRWLIKSDFIALALTSGLSSATSRETSSARFWPRLCCSRKKLWPKSGSETDWESKSVNDPTPGKTRFFRTWAEVAVAGPMRMEARSSEAWPAEAQSLHERAD